jgi:hypothetical protein
MSDTTKELTDSQKILVDAIVKALQSKKQSSAVRLWVWVKKVLSFAHSEASKIILDE